MNSGFDIKQFILEKTKNYISRMPEDVYALYFFINTNEGFAATPTLSLMYNTHSEVAETGIEPIETCWNIACWYTDEFPIIGNNTKDTKEADEEMRMLADWFLDIGLDASKTEQDPLDNYYEYTVGYRVLTDVLMSIAPDVKTLAREKFGADVVMLFGEYSYVPSDIEKIIAINGTEARPFIDYCEEELLDVNIPFHEPEPGMKADEDAQEDIEKVLLDFLNQLNKDSKP